MPPLTFAILVSVLKVHGSDAAIESENKGVQDLLAGMYPQVSESLDPYSPRLVPVTHAKDYTKGYGKGTTYAKTYNKEYSRWINAQPPSGSSGRPTSGGTRK